jgi:hypothetical protein
MSNNKKIDKIDIDRNVASSNTSSTKDIDALTDAAVTISDMVSDDRKNINDGNSKAFDNDGHSASDAGNVKFGALDASVAAGVATNVAANEAELTASFPQKVRYV